MDIQAVAKYGGRTATPLVAAGKTSPVPLSVALCYSRSPCTEAFQIVRYFEGCLGLILQDIPGDKRFPSTCA